jgi:hypothetical protein
MLIQVPGQAGDTNKMNILCNVNQTECLRYGIDAPSSTVKIEVDPKALSQDQRDFLADQLNGGLRFPRSLDYHICPPTYEGLLAAISYGMKCEQQTESADIREHSVWRKEAVTQAIQDMEARIADKSKKAEAESRSLGRSLSLQSNPDPAQFEGTLKMFQKRSG